MRDKELAEEFFYWAEELAAHGFNCAHQNKMEDFIPLAREYWNQMYEAREVLRKRLEV